MRLGRNKQQRRRLPALTIASERVINRHGIVHPFRGSARHQRLRRLRRRYMCAGRCCRPVPELRLLVQRTTGIASDQSATLRRTSRRWPVLVVHEQLRFIVLLRPELRFPVVLRAHALVVRVAAEAVDDLLSGEPAALVWLQRRSRD